MRIKFYLGIFIVIILIFSLTAQLPAAKLTFSINAHLGLTLVDVGDATGWYDDVVDWDTFFFGFFGQGFYQMEKFSVGLEVGYSRLYYYYAVVPYGYQPIRYEGESAPMKGLLITQIEITDSIFLQAGAGLHFFDDPAFGFMGSLRYHLKISDKIQIPIFLRSDLIIGTGTPFVLSFGSGVVIIL